MHGVKFRQVTPRTRTARYLVIRHGDTARLGAWTWLHFKDLPVLVGMVVRVEFLFAKRRMGLLIAQTSDLVAPVNWGWVVTFAYTQLLLARMLATAQPRPWDPKSRRDS